MPGRAFRTMIAVAAVALAIAGQQEGDEEDQDRGSEDHAQQDQESEDQAEQDQGDEDQAEENQDSDNQTEQDQGNEDQAEQDVGTEDSAEQDQGAEHQADEDAAHQDQGQEEQAEQSATHKPRVVGMVGGQSGEESLDDGEVAVAGQEAHDVDVDDTDNRLGLDESADLRDEDDDEDVLEVLEFDVDEEE